MKLLRASFENFRLLRDLELHFSDDPDRKLTVIRAANESGKTTVLNGLQWALYGDAALPKKGDEYRLHPIDWDESQGRHVPITATIDFELTKYHRTPSGQREVRLRYRLVRSAVEEVDGSVSQRSPSTVKLFALRDEGADPMNAPEAFINDELPPELRDIFFTDGDRALSFIEAEVALATKRGRVERAIRSLLGLGVIEDATHHVRKAESDVNKQAKQLGGNGELSRIASRLEAIEEAILKSDRECEDAKLQFGALDEKVEETDRAIAAALQRGDKDNLRREIEQAQRKIKQLDDRLEDAVKEHSALFRGQHVAADLLDSVFGDAFAKLEEMHDQGKIPNTTIPVLEDRLAAGVCICGETLKPDDVDGRRRCDHIRALINDSRRADEIQGTITELYFGAKSLRPPSGAGSRWRDDYRKVLKSRDGLQTLRDEAGRELRSLELQLDELPDTDIRGLREARRQYKDQRDRCLARQASAETQLQGLKQNQAGLSQERERLLREQKRGALILAELEVTQDVANVLERAYKRIAGDELRKVSDLMNANFLEMIGADPEQGAVIRRAEISREFDILVYGPNDRSLNPDRDLNGASRRALTLAFILALTKVSEVEAPNVIDTPLGMTSGYVKRSILRVAVRESSQLVLFLTHDEIAGCEDILDEAAGVVLTLTNTAHYPRMLLNDPRVPDRKALRCGCNHRHTCRLCERRANAEKASAAAL